MHDQTDRAYPLSAEEVAAYNWIAHNTPGLAVVAADPQHQVNQAGETIATTNFLSGETERPAYVQRVVPFNTQETQARMQLMDQLLHAHSAEEVRSLLQRATFDYLVVYADKAPSVDLTCCMKLVFDGSPRVYQVVSDPTPP